MRGPAACSTEPQSTPILVGDCTSACNWQDRQRSSVSLIAAKFNERRKTQRVKQTEQKNTEDILSLSICATFCAYSISSCTTFQTQSWQHCYMLIPHCMHKLFATEMGTAPGREFLSTVTVRGKRPRTEDRMSGAVVPRKHSCAWLCCSSIAEPC